MTAEPCALESPESAAALLERYDPATGRWSYAKRERFWDAVAVAHSQGRRGRGVHIAIIDGSFDMSMEAIASRAGIHRPTRQPGGQAHGTAVVLLIAEVAPEAELHLYEVCDPAGVPEYAAICAAIGEAVENGTHTISLSLGRYQSPEQDRQRHAGSSPELFDGRVPDPGAEGECELCREAAAAVTQGVSVVAAAGNHRDLILCPARAHSVVGCGFQFGVHTSVPTTDGGATIYASARPPSAQAQFVDFLLEQPEGVLGTSFATALFAAFLALCEDRTQIPALLRSLSLASVATVLEGQLSADKRMGQEPTHELLMRIDEIYKAAFKALPHHHLPGDPPCPECSLFGEVSYANWGRFMLFTERQELGERLLRGARDALPRSQHVAANLGAVVHHRASTVQGRERRKLLDEAAGLYRAACEHAIEGAAKTEYLRVLADIERECARAAS